VRAALIIVEQPGFDDMLGLDERGELVLVQTLISKLTIELSTKAFCIGSPGWMKWSVNPR
jgi:hypothetical protein